jgi:hypothetical protein
MTNSHNRLNALSYIRSHPWLHRLFKGLKSYDIALMENFIIENDSLDSNEFEKKINRLFLDQGDAKPRRWKEISEILSSANSHAKG